MRGCFKARKTCSLGRGWERKAGRGSLFLTAGLKPGLLTVQGHTAPAGPTGEALGCPSGLIVQQEAHRQTDTRCAPRKILADAAVEYSPQQTLTRHSQLGWEQALCSFPVSPLCSPQSKMYVLLSPPDRARDHFRNKLLRFPVSHTTPDPYDFADRNGQSPQIHSHPPYTHTPCTHTHTYSPQACTHLLSYTHTYTYRIHILSHPYSCTHHTHTHSTQRYSPQAHTQIYHTMHTHIHTHYRPKHTPHQALNTPYTHKQACPKT